MGRTAKCPEPLCHQLGVTGSWVMSSTTSEGVTPPSSLLLAHVPVPNPPAPSGCSPRSAGLCRLLSAPAGSGTFPTLALHVFPRVLGPLSRQPLRCTYPFLPSRHRPSPRWLGSALSYLPVRSDFGTAFAFGSAVIPLCSGPRFCSPPRSLLPQGETPALGSRDLLRPSRTRFVTSSCIGYASRLNRVIAGRGLSPH